jgi:AmmeMemoRadiSam system protein A
MNAKDQLTEEEGHYLLKVARKTIEQTLFKSKEAGGPEAAPVSAKFSEPRGTFVTLTIEHGLRGCIGHIIPQESLLEGVKENAINAAFRDPRFPPLSKKEFENIRVEVSILTEPKDLPYQDAADLLKKIRPNLDGLIIKKGYRQATFLPQVWEQLPDVKEFLSHLCMKAGLDAEEWKKGTLEVQTYQVQAFEEE